MGVQKNEKNSNFLLKIIVKRIIYYLKIFNDQSYNKTCVSATNIGFEVRISVVSQLIYSLKIKDD